MLVTNFSTVESGMKEKYNIIGMSCAVCAKHVEKAVRQLPNIANVEVNLLQNFMLVDYDETKIKSDDIVKAVQIAGYDVSLPLQEQSKKKTINNNL